MKVIFYSTKCEYSNKLLQYLEKNNNQCFLEDYMRDSTHYSKDYEKIKEKNEL